jgi:hypothetical protein
VEVPVRHSAKPQNVKATIAQSRSVLNFVATRRSALLPTALSATVLRVASVATVTQ